MKHAFTIDVEDWYQGIPIAEESKASAERRLGNGMGPLLDLLAEHDYKATFFFLGPVAQEHPEWVRRTAAAGHEIGSHGWSHEFVYNMDRERFRAETQQAMDVISEITGAPVRSYRAAYFSVTNKSLWALDVLCELGYRYDASIIPVKNWRYGIPDYDPAPQRVKTESGDIYEMPITIRNLWGRNWPVAGGAYFRIYPYPITRRNIRAVEGEGRPAIFYVHPWELDPAHPRVDFHWKPRLTHYVNLRSTEPKLRKLFRDFQFGTLAELVDQEFGSE